MHDSPLHDTDGKFTSDSKLMLWCDRCHGNTQHRHQIWESDCGGYVDEKFTCTQCQREHWVDGIDS